MFPSNGAGVDDSGAEDDRDDRSISFGEKLRAGKDDEEPDQSDEESKVVLQEQDRESNLFSFVALPPFLCLLSYDRRGGGRHCTSSTREVVFPC